MTTQGDWHIEVDNHKNWLLNGMYRMLSDQIASDLCLVGFFFWFFCFAFLAFKKQFEMNARLLHDGRDVLPTTSSIEESCPSYPQTIPQYFLFT